MFASIYSEAVRVVSMSSGHVLVLVLIGHDSTNFKIGPFRLLKSASPQGAHEASGRWRRVSQRGSQRVSRGPFGTRN